jgi:hypothetical protein
MSSFLKKLFYVWREHYAVISPREEKEMKFRRSEVGFLQRFATAVVDKRKYIFIADGPVL